MKSSADYADSSGANKKNDVRAERKAIRSKTVRIDGLLVDAARQVGEIYGRSESRQIERWIALGRSLSTVVSEEQTYALISEDAILESASLRPNKRVDSEVVLSAIEKLRTDGSLQTAVRPRSDKAVAIFDVDDENPGLLVRTESNGDQARGYFKDGEFIVTNSI